jgi:hypothetical protein
LFVDKEDKKNGLELPSNGTSLDLLQAVYRNPELELGVRIKAAGMAIGFEHPKLAVTAQVSDEGLAELLDARLKRLAEAKRIEAPPPQIETKPHPPNVPDKRFRRI